MDDDGLKEVANPSEMMLSGRLKSIFCPQPLRAQLYLPLAFFARNVQNSMLVPHKPADL